MANRYSAGCQCCQEAGCSGCVDRYLTSVTVEVGEEVLSIPVNKKIAELVNCEINYNLCGDETEVTVLDYSIDHAWDGRTCPPCESGGGGGPGGEGGGGAGIGFGGGGPQPSLPNCIPCSDRPCDSDETDYLLRVFSFDNLEYLFKVKYQVRYAVTLKFLSTGVVDVYVAVQLYYRTCIRYSFDATYYVNKNCPLEASDCGIINDPESCRRYIDCDWEGADWQIECGPLYRCESDGVQNSEGRMPGEEEAQQAFHCCDHAGCIADANISMSSCIDENSTFSATVYYGERYWEIVGLDACPNSFGQTEGACTCDSGTDGWYAQSTFRGTASFTYDEADECICPAEFEVPEESRCLFYGDCGQTLVVTWPYNTYSWDPCIIAKCAIATPFQGEPVPLSPDCCLDTETTPAPTTIDLRPLDPGSAVYVTLNCT